MKSEAVKFVVNFHYMDGEDFCTEVHPDDMDAFMTCVGKSEVYFNESRGVGVWIPIDRIRYFRVESVDERGNRVRVRDSGVPEGKSASLTPKGSGSVDGNADSEDFLKPHLSSGDGGV